MSSFFSFWAECSFWEKIGMGCTLAVALGVIGELLLILKGSPYNPTHFEHFEKAKGIWEKICSGLVALGVAGELFAMTKALPESHREVAEAKTEGQKASQKAEELRAANLKLQREILAMDPRNQPVETVSVNQVSIEVIGEDYSDDQSRMDPELIFGHFTGSQTNTIRSLLRGHVSPLRLVHGTNRVYKLDFDSSEFQIFLSEPFTPAQVDAVAVLLPRLRGRHPVRIVEGQITLILNNIKMSFPIPPQTNDSPIATSLRTNSTFIPIPFVPGSGWNF
jgi:hypothetical protein